MVRIPREPALCWTSTPPYAGSGTGWDLHEYRHSSLTQLGGQGASLLMARSRRKKPKNVPLHQALTGVDRRAHQPARPGRHPALGHAGFQAAAS
ncbi:MAG TPA: hypothetical protein VGD71_18475 [Kribbella sp.]